MHRILLKIKIPYFLKLIFGVFPMGLGIAFGVVGLAFLFFGPKWILKEEYGKEADSKTKLNAKQKMWLKFTFWLGIIFVVIGIGSVAVALLDNSDLEEIAKGQYAIAVSSIDENITAPTAQQAYDLMINQTTHEWMRESAAYKSFERELGKVSNSPSWLDPKQKKSYGDTYFVGVCEDFLKYMRSTKKIDFEDFKEKFDDFKEVPKHAPLKVIEVPSYGVMVMLGFLTAILIAYARAKQYGIDPNVIIDLGIVVMIAAIVGARIWYVIEYWSRHIKPEGTTFWQGLGNVFMIQQGGLVFYGGMILAMISSIVYLKMKKQPVLLFFDFIAILIPLGHAFGRTGCFLNGCCYGKHCDVNHFLAVAFPGGTIGAENPVYATQMLAVFTNLLIFILLTVYYETLAKKRGETFFMYFLLYGISRFISHLFRGDVEDVVAGLSSSQFLSVLLFVGGLIGVIFFRFFYEKGKPAHLAGIGDAGPFKRIKLAELEK